MKIKECSRYERDRDRERDDAIGLWPSIFPKRYRKRGDLVDILLILLIYFTESQRDDEDERDRMHKKH